MFTSTRGKTVAVCLHLALVFAITLTAVAWLATPARAAQDGEPVSLVRYWIDSPQDEEFLRAHPRLDVIYVKTGVHADIVATPEDLELIRDAGARFDIVHRDFVAFFKSRMGPDRSDDFGVYHNWEEQVAFVDSLRLNYPTVISQKWSLGQSHEGRDIWCIRVSDNPEIDEDEPEILFDGLHHAREPMSGEFCIMFAEYLGQNYGVDPEITWLLDNRELYIVPCVNPDGYWFNDWGEMWRKNRRDNPGGCEGVDNNRNYPYMWGYDNVGSSGDPCDDDYRGPSPGSEPETQAILDLVNSHEFVTRNSYHCHGNLTLYPWGYTNTPTAEDDIFVHMADIMVRYNGYAPGQLGDGGLYTVNGGSVDWDYGATDEHPRIFGFTNEIGGPGDWFWPPESRRGDLFRDNIWPSIYLMRAAGAFVDVSQQVVIGGNMNGRLDPGESAGLSFTVENQGVIDGAQNVTMVLTSADPYLQLHDVTRNLGDLDPLEIVDLISDPFAVTVDAACPTGRVIEVTVLVEQQDGGFEYSFGFPVGTPTVVYSTDFEMGTSDWTLTGAWGLTTGQSHSPSHSLTDSPSGNYPDESTTHAELNDGYFATSLSFWHRYAIEEDWDYGYVQVSADGGPWTTIATYTGFQSSWSQQTLPLDDFAGQEVRIRFQLATDTWVNEDGWYIDDVTLYGYESTNLTPPPPVLIAPAPGATVDATPELTVANSIDPDGPGPLTYGFRVYGDIWCTDLVVAVDGVAEGTAETSWTTPTLDQGIYWWRAYAADPVERGLLGETRSFVVYDPTAVGAPITQPRLVVLGSVADGQARVRLDLPSATRLSLDIYDVRGRLVRQLLAGDLPGGSRVLTWDGRDASGAAAASGLYFVRLLAGPRMLTERVVLVR